jgi:hypothetical protein
MHDYPAGYWLLKAEEARTKADQVRDAAARATILEIAERYELMGQRTASKGERISPMCRTAKNRRFVLPSIGADHA